jgi:hypothetical protein
MSLYHNFIFKIFSVAKNNWNIFYGNKTFQMFLDMLNILKMNLWYKDIQNVFSYAEYLKNESMV